MVQEEHSLRLVGRAELTITGVTEVSRFEEDGVLLQTDMGELTVQGEQLQLKELSLDGGRVAVSGSISAATAVMGTMLSIKPILHVDNEGHLVSVGKVRGRKASIQALAEKVGELARGYDNPVMFISHGDCPEDAQYLADLLKQRYGVKEVYINYVGAVIGSHSGPGTLALFFLGDHR